MLSVILIRVLIAMLLISLLSATAGTMSVFKGSTFFVSGVAHAALAGAALGVYMDEHLFPTNPYAVSCVFAVLMAVSVAYMERRGLRAETGVGVAFSVSMSFAVLILSLLRDSATRAWGLIIGDPYLLTDGDIAVMLAVTLFVVVAILGGLRRFVLISFDPEGAEYYGANVTAYNVLLYALIGVAVVVLLQGVGMILVYALLIIPPVVGMRLGRDVNGVILVAFAVSVACGLTSTGISYVTSLPVSALSGLLLAGAYALTLLRRRA